MIVLLRLKRPRLIDRGYKDTFRPKKSKQMSVCEILGLFGVRANFVELLKSEEVEEKKLRGFLRR